MSMSFCLKSSYAADPLKFMRLAIINADASELESLCLILHDAGYQTQSFSNSTDLTRLLRRDSHDLLILDWPTLDSNGADLVSTVRERLQTSIPVLFLTGASTQDDIVTALDAGANDYLIRPIRRSELVARVEVLLRRAFPMQHQPEILDFGRFTFELRSGRFAMDGKSVELTQKEFDLALLLLRNLGRPLSRAFILESVWSRDVDNPSRTLDTHISRVRNKLQLHAEHGFSLVPVYGYGYRLEQFSNDVAND